MTSSARIIDFYMLCRCFSAPVERRGVGRSRLTRVSRAGAQTRTRCSRHIVDRIVLLQYRLLSVTYGIEQHEALSTDLNFPAGVQARTRRSSHIVDQLIILKYRFLSVAYGIEQGHRLTYFGFDERLPVGSQFWPSPLFLPYTTQ